MFVKKQTGKEMALESVHLWVLKLENSSIENVSGFCGLWSVSARGLLSNGFSEQAACPQSISVTWEPTFQELCPHRAPCSPDCWLAAARVGSQKGAQGTHLLPRPPLAAAASLQ